MSEIERQLPDFGSTEAVTPYQKATQVWDQRMGNATAAATAWKTAFFLVTGAIVLLSIVLVVMASRQEFYPYIVEVTSEGRVVNIVPSTEIYEPNKAQIRYFLTGTVTTLAELSMDPVLVRHNWQKLYDFFTIVGSRLLTAHIEQTKPFAELGKQRTSVTVNNFLHLAGESYQLQWTTSSFNPNGKFLGEKQWIGTFVIEVVTPTSQDQILRNPLGLYVRAFEVIEAKSVK